MLLILFTLLTFLNNLYAETEALQTKELLVIFEKPIENIAKELAEVYPSVKTEIVGALKWKVDFKPEIILVKDKEALKKIVGNHVIVAFAVPERNLIVLDTSRVYTKPFTLEATLKHELCHILLHHNIDRENLPRWLDEGVCQWTSGGIAELMASEVDRALEKAAMSDMVISIMNLSRFPQEEKSLLLAYEESKSIVEYIVNNYSEQGILQVLEYLKEGYSIDDSIQKSLSVSTSELEMKWLAHIKRKHTWFSYLSNNIYFPTFFIKKEGTQHTCI